jgi:hypothetical protein
MPAIANHHTMTPIQQFLTESEIGRLAGLPMSALKRLLISRGIKPAAETAQGRIRLYPPAVADQLRKATRTK